VFELLELKEEVVRLKLAVVNVPRVTVMLRKDWRRASPSVTVIPTPSIKRKVLKLQPLLVSVLVALIIKLPEWLKVVVDDSVTFPDTVIVAEPENVPVKPVVVRLLAPVLPVAIVMVPLEFASKKTSSADVGTDAPPVPPLVAAHFVPAVPSQEPVPPTQ